MKKFTGALVSTFLNINNVRMIDEVIKDVLERQPEVPVTINFARQSIGKSNRFFIKDDGLHCDFEIDEAYIPPLIERAYVVPGMNNVVFHYEGNTRVITGGDLTELSISLLPADPNLRPIKLKGDKE
jgi:hypothetical protein